MARGKSLRGPFFGGISRGRLMHNAGNFLSQFGPELVVNGGFDSDTIWTKGTGWTIEDGTAVGAAGSASALTQGPADLTQGVTYRVMFDIVTISAGGVGPNIGSTLGTIQTVAGRYVEDVIAGAGSAIVMDKDAAFVGKIDNVSVREVG